MRYRICLIRPVSQNISQCQRSAFLLWCFFVFLCFLLSLIVLGVVWMQVFFIVLFCLPLLDYNWHLNTVQYQECVRILSVLSPLYDHANKHKKLPNDWRLSVPLHNQISVSYIGSRVKTRRMINFYNLYILSMYQ